MGGGKGGEVGGGYGAKLRDERHLAKLVQLARTPDEKGFGDRRIRLVTNFLIGIIHLYRPAGGTTPTPPSLLRATRGGPRFSTSMETTLHSFWKRNLNGWTSSKEARKIRDDDWLGCTTVEANRHFQSLHFASETL